MTPDWPSLWKREPALKPEWMHLDMEPDFVCDQFPRAEGEKVGATLCRDAAVGWLDGQLQGSLCCFTLHRSTKWQIYQHEGYSDFKDIGEPGATKDEALFNACKAILDARDPPPAKP